MKKCRNCGHAKHKHMILHNNVICCYEIRQQIAIFKCTCTDFKKVSTYQQFICAKCGNKAKLTAYNNYVCIKCNHLMDPKSVKKK